MDAIGLFEENVSKKKQGELFFPDELVTNILSRLPPASVAKCRLVCKGWRDLTLSGEFVDKIFRNSIPTILVTNPRSYTRLDLFALDMWWDDSSITQKTIRRFPFYSGMFPNTSRAVFSEAGLIVLRENPKQSRDEEIDIHYNILNPVMPVDGCVRITLATQLWGSKIYGVYFHPILKEYCSLWRIDPSTIPWFVRRQFPFKILNLGSNPSLRTVSIPVFDNGKKKGATSPLFIDNYLYWLLESPEGLNYTGRNDIMQFNIITEQFRVLPCPVPWNTKCRYHQTRLLNIDGILCFLAIFRSKIKIWRLELQGEQIQFWRTLEYTLSIEVSMDVRRVIAVVDGKLALVTKEGKLLVFNLMEGTVMKYPNRKFKGDAKFLSHRIGLASLSNCKPTITIDRDENVGAA